MMLEAYVRFGLTHPNAYRLVFCDSPLASVEKREITGELGAQCFERFSGVVREIAAQGRLRTGDPKSVAQILWVGCHGVAAMMITRPTNDWAEPEEMTRLMIEGLLFGLIAD
jgi:hypothetical protein